MDHIPVARLDIALDSDVFGKVTYPGESVYWDLPGQTGQPGASLAGFALDPTGGYVMQAPVGNLWQDCGDAQWTKGGGDTGTYAHGKDGATGKLFLRQTSPTATTFNTTLAAPRAADEGFFCEVYRAQTSAGNLYLNFSGGRTSGAPGLRLAVEVGNMIRLQRSTDNDATWQDVALANELGDSENALNPGRYFTVDVLSQCDPAWSQSSDSPQPPPGQIVVTVTCNGGAATVLTCAASSLSAGSLKITGTLGQWGVTRYAKKRFAVSGTMTLPGQVRPRAFQGTPVTALRGYRGTSSGFTITTTTTGAGMNSLQSSLTFAAPPGGIDGTGYATSTAFLTAVTAVFDPVFVAPAAAPAYTTYEPTYVELHESWDQPTMTVRQWAVVKFIDTDGSLAPGTLGVLPAVRAGALSLGYLIDNGDGTYTEDMTLHLTGYTGLHPSEPGFSWRKSGGQTFVTLILYDRLVKAQMTPVGYQLPFDGLVHYYAMRRMGHKIGYSDADMTWPSVGPYDAGYYHLPQGDALSPEMEFSPSEKIAGCMEEIRRLSGEIDAGSGEVLPMLLAPTPEGQLDYQPLPLGIVQSLTNPFTSASAYGIAPSVHFSPLAPPVSTPPSGKIIEALETTASLAQIRSPFVAIGLDPLSGGAVVGVAANDQVITDPNAFGYIGAVECPLVDINRLYSSQAVADHTVRLASISLALPSVTDKFPAYLQPGMFPLTVFGVTDPETQGTTGEVVYYATDLVHRYWIQAAKDRITRHGITEVSGRLLGTAG